MCILNHLAEEQGGHRGRRWAAFYLAAHTKAAHSQQQRGQGRMWPPSSFRWPDIAQQPRPPGANTIHNTPSHWTTSRPRGARGGWQGLWVSAACRCVIVLWLINNTTSRHSYFFLASSYCQLTFTLSTKCEESWEPYWKNKKKKTWKDLTCLWITAIYITNSGWDMAYRIVITDVWGECRELPATDVVIIVAADITFRAGLNSRPVFLA